MDNTPGRVLVTSLIVLLALFVYPRSATSQVEQAVWPEIPPETCQTPYNYAKKEKEEIIGCFGDSGSNRCYCLSRDKEGAVFKRWSSKEKCKAGDTRCKPRKSG